MVLVVGSSPPFYSRSKEQDIHSLKLGLELSELQTEPASDTESQVNPSVQQPLRIRIYPLEQWLIAYQTLHQRVFYYLIDTSFCLKECLFVMKNSLINRIK